MSDFAPKVSTPVADVDKAETFAESGVTVRGGSVESGSLTMSLDMVEDYADGAYTSPLNSWGYSDDDSFSADGGSEIDGTYAGELTYSGGPARIDYDAPDILYPQVVRVKMKPPSTTSSTSDYTRLAVRDGSGNGTQVEFNLGNGDVTHDGTVVATYTAGEIYAFTLTFDWVAGNVTLTDANHAIDNTESIGGDNVQELRFTGSTFNSGASRSFYIDTIEVGHDTGATAWVEWGIPTDIYAWDAASFQQTLDGESVSIYVEEAQGSPGWTEVAGPIARGDSIPADPANNVRFRIELSRSNTANKPSVDAIYRRYAL